MFEADIYLRLLHTSIVDIYKVFEPLVCCLKGIWMHPYTITPAKLPPDLGSQCHKVMFEADIYLRPLHTSILDIYKVFESHWYAVSRAYGCSLILLHRPSCPQIWGFRFTWGVEVMPQCHGWGWYPLQTTSYIHPRHIQSVWDIGKLSQGHMGAPLFRYTGQAGPSIGDSGSLVKWKRCHNVMVEADIHAPLIAIVSCDCPHSSSTLRGTSSQRPNMAY
jgi:hypothetical protein